MRAHEMHHEYEMIGPGGHAIPRVSVQHALYVSLMRVIYAARKERVIYGAGQSR